MNSAYQNIDRVLAIGRLYEFSSNKRFHLIANEFIDDAIGRKALEINNEIKNIKGIDIFEAKEDRDLLEYQKILNQYTTNITEQTFKFKDTEATIELYEKQIYYSKDKWLNSNIEIDALVKQHIKKYELTIPGAINLLKTPESIIFLEELKTFIITRKVRVKNKERILLAILNIFNPDTHTNNLEESHSMLPFNHGYRDLSASIFVLFKYENFGSLLNNPTKLFIKLLELYGVETDINNQNRKLYLHTFLPPYIKDIVQARAYLKERRNIVTAYLLRNSRIAIEVIYLYALDLNKAMNDFVKGEI